MTIAASLAGLLAAHGLGDVAEEPFPNDGWSGATLTRLRRGDDAFVLKRTSWSADWIVRATGDRTLREAVVADGRLELTGPVRTPHLGVAVDADGVAMLMPDLTDALFAWEHPVAAADVDAVLRNLAALHATPVRPDAVDWCPLPTRLSLLTPASAEGYLAAGLPFAERFLTGWNAFARHARPAAVDLVTRLAAEPAPLVAALDTLPPALLHGDLKLGNAGFVDGRMVLIDWAMVMRAPVAVELGWFLVANVASLPIPPDEVLRRYVAAAEPGEPGTEVDLAWIVGLLLRGWRKGLDADAAVVLPTGATAAEDLEHWSRRAAEAAERRL